MSKTFIVSCFRCYQDLKVPVKSTGVEAKCPACGGKFTVPSVSENAKIQEQVPVEVREFRTEELSRIREEDPSLLKLVQGGTNKNCWEFLLLAELIRRSLVPLLEAIASEPDQVEETHVIFWSRQRYLSFVDSKCSEFLDFQVKFSKLFGTGLREALFKDDVLAIFSFRDHLSRLLVNLLSCYNEFISKAVPMDADCNRLFGFMRTWFPHYVSVMEEIPDQLREVHRNSGVYLRHVEAQISFTPSNVRPFFILREGITKKKIFTE